MTDLLIKMPDDLARTSVGEFYFRSTTETLLMDEDDFLHSALTLWVVA